MSILHKTSVEHNGALWILVDWHRWQIYNLLYWNFPDITKMFFWAMVANVLLNNAFMAMKDRFLRLLFDQQIANFTKCNVDWWQILSLNYRVNQHLTFYGEVTKINNNDDYNDCHYCYIHYNWYISLSTKNTF